MRISAGADQDSAATHSALCHCITGGLTAVLRTADGLCRVATHSRKAQSFYNSESHFVQDFANSLTKPTRRSVNERGVRPARKHNLVDSLHLGG